MSDEQDQKPQVENVVFRPSVDALMNRGVEVQVYKVKTEVEVDPMTDEPIEVFEPDRDQPKVWIRVRMTNQVLAELETQYGTLQNWNDQLSRQSLKVIGNTMALCMRKRFDFAVAALDQTAMEEYQFAIYIAYLIAMGADGEQLGKMIPALSRIHETKKELVAQSMASMDVMTKALQIKDAVSDVLTRGPISSELGSTPDTDTTSSGNEVQPKSSSSSTDQPETNGEEDLQKRPVRKVRPAPRKVRV